MYVCVGGSAPAAARYGPWQGLTLFGSTVYVLSLTNVS